MTDHAAFLKLLADPTRLKLLKLILDEDLCVCELQLMLGISQPAVSQHIARLKAASLVTERHAGTWTYYRADRERLMGALAAVTGFLDAAPETVPELAALRAKREGLDSADICRIIRADSVKEA